MKNSQNRKRTAAAGGAVGLVGLLGLAGRAHAADAAQDVDGYVAATSIEGVDHMRAMPGGGYEFVMKDGRTIAVGADQVMMKDGAVYIADAAAAQFAPVEGGVHSVGEFLVDNALAVGAGVVGGGLGIAAAAGAFDSDDSAPNRAPSFVFPAAAVTAENATGPVFVAEAEDADSASVSYALSGGADAGLFVIDETTGALSFAAAPNFETPADADGDNQYEVIVSASDGVSTVEQAVTVTVTDVNEAPVFQNAASVEVTENRTAAFTAMAPDPENANVVYALEGADAHLFEIDPLTGVVTFLEAPDFEAPQDADADNVYDVTVVASDGVNTTSQAVSIAVADQIEIVGTDGADAIVGGAESEAIAAGAGDDLIEGGGARDFIETGEGADRLFYAGDPFDGVDVSAEGRQVSGNEDFISDFDFASDVYSFNAADGGIEGPLSFVSLDANAEGADIPDGANVIVLTNSDNDDNPDTPFLAVTAAEQIASLVETPGAGYFVYFNSNLNVNRLVYSSDLSDPNADLSIISRHTDLEGQDAIDALADFTEANFEFVGDLIAGTDGNDALVGGGQNDFIEAAAGDDLIEGQGGRDFITTGAGADRIFYADDPFDGVDVSAEGRQVSGNEDFISDFDFASDIYSFNAIDGGIEGPLSFVSLDANAPGADIPDGANVIVLTNSDNDDNPDTPFLAVTAAEQIASLVETPGAGYFVYFNSNLNVNRLVYSSDLSDPNADLSIVSRHVDLTGQDAIDALADFTEANFEFVGDLIAGTDGDDVLTGGAQSDFIEAGAGDDHIEGGGSRDFIATGAGADVIAFAGDPFDGVDVSAPGRQVSGNEDFVSDFDFASDVYAFNAADGGIEGGLAFISLDANAVGADIPDGANVIVLTNSDNDDNPDTPFLAVTAAEQIASLVETPGAGYFVYFNSNLDVNRLVYSSDLSDPNADLSIVSRHVDLTGQDAIDALGNFTAGNFVFEGEVLTGTDGADMLIGAGGSDEINALGGDDYIEGKGGRDFIATGEGADVIAFAGDPFDGVDVSAEGRQVSGNEDFVSDFDFASDVYELNADDFAISGPLSFVSLDANAEGADIPDGANVIVLTNSDNDDNPDTPFLAVTAAEQIASLVETPGSGFFVYFNSNLNVNRLAYSSDLSDPNADLSIISRHTDLEGQDAIDALADFTEANFVLASTAVEAAVSAFADLSVDDAASVALVAETTPTEVQDVVLLIDDATFVQDVDLFAAA